MATPLYFAVVGDHYDAFILLLEHGADPNACYCTSSHSQFIEGNRLIIAMADKPDFVMALIEYGAELFNKTSLLYIYRYELDIMRLLIDHGDDINKGILRFANSEPTIDDWPAIKLLIDRGADINANRMMPHHDNSLLCTICNSNIGIDAVQYLINHGADVNYTYCRGHNLITPLISACCANNVDVVKLLIKYGAKDATPVGGNVITALHIACMKGNLKLVKLLVDNYDYDRWPEDATCPLDMFLHRDHTDIIAYLKSKELL